MLKLEVIRKQITYTNRISLKKTSKKRFEVHKYMNIYTVLCNSSKNLAFLIPIRPLLIPSGVKITISSLVDAKSWADANHNTGLSLEFEL